ncbi:N-6 DNA methylase [Proteiniborus sp. MB09-C3]|uniref:N-6 DNA methylase n=1 Tax=Proteiniborus sp. MB09-C3 TaxID=3050072 RepID=UPI002557850A|nr:N-6 DNA methylase [Proteiniborus sp. MB09-C3]WIV13682.1 N-6 DNA methylase [Proteiniborus sp. MB09-C3]
MFVQTEKFMEEHQGKVENLSIYGQECNSTTWKLYKMSIVIKDIDENLGHFHAFSAYRLKCLSFIDTI